MARDAPSLGDRAVRSGWSLIAGNGPFRALLFARTVTILGNVMSPIALAFVVLDLDGLQGAARLALVVAGGQIVQTALLLFGGVIADRFPRGMLMSRTELFSGVCQVGIAVMATTGTINWFALAALFALKGAGNALFLPASGGVLPTVVDKSELRIANATLRLSMNVVRVSGAALSAVVAIGFGAHIVLWVDAATYLVSWLLLVTQAWPAVDVTTRKSILGDLKEGWHEFSSRRWIFVPVIQMAYINAVFSAFMAILGPTILKYSGDGIAGWSALVTGHTIGLVAGSFIAMKAKFKDPIRASILLAAGKCIPMVLVAAHYPLWAGILAMAFAAVLIDIYSVTWDSTLQSEVPAESLSRVSSYDMLASFSGAPLAVSLTGVLLGLWAPEALVIGMGVGVVIVTLIAWWRVGHFSSTCTLGPNPQNAGTSTSEQ